MQFATINGFLIRQLLGLYKKHFLNVSGMGFDRGGGGGFVQASESRS